MINKIKGENLYFINYQENEKELCQMEMKYLLKDISNDKLIFSKLHINPSRSPFIKWKIEIIYESDTLDEIINEIIKDNLAYDNFKVNYIKSEHKDVDYNERLMAVRNIGFVITGCPDIHNPQVNLAITKLNEKWIFGKYIKNDYKWQEHNNKPYSYSNAVSLKMARALVNIAIGDNINDSLVDPCCGVGTVVIEAMDLGVNVKGYEISKQMAFNSRENIEYFGYERDTIICGDMHEIKEKYDVAIIDMPYGLFSPITKEEQIAIINTSSQICDKLVIITFENMDKYIKEAGFNIIDKCVVPKGSFKRYISVCIKKSQSNN